MAVAHQQGQGIDNEELEQKKLDESCNIMKDMRKKSIDKIVKE